MIPMLGVFGIHKFILGYNTEGIIQLIIGVITCGAGSVIGLIEGIIYLTKSDEEFVRTYIQNKKGWF
jgi:TM2 domain-containing membrane protein YozV